jgi:hypothetical protein
VSALGIATLKGDPLKLNILGIYILKFLFAFLGGMFIKYVGKNIDYTKTDMLAFFCLFLAIFLFFLLLKKEKSSCFWVNCLGIGPSAVTS